MELAGPRIFSRGVHRVFPECRHLPGPSGNVGKQAESLFLPQVQKADSDVAEPASDQLAVATWEMCGVQSLYPFPLFRGGAAHRYSFRCGGMAVCSSITTRRLVLMGADGDFSIYHFH